MLKPVEEIIKELSDALARQGFGAEQARSLTQAAVDAELHNNPEHGISHLDDYLGALARGAINGHAAPSVDTRGSIVSVNAEEGLSQHAFLVAFDKLVKTARAQGVAFLSLSRSFTTGELGWYARLLAKEGFIALVGTNSPALVTAAGGTKRVLGTNPLAFAVPDSLLIDQATSEAAYQKIRSAARRGEEIPAGWAVDKQGHPTTSAEAAVDGALLPFGGRKGANIALIMELLTMLGGGNAGIEAASYTSGDASPRVGLFALVLDPTTFGEDALGRLQSHLATLSDEHDVYIPGAKKISAPRKESIEIDDEIWESLMS